MKALTVDTPDLESVLAPGGKLFTDFDLASLGVVDTSTLSDTLKAVTSGIDFSEVKRSPPALVTALVKLRKFGGPLLCLILPSNQNAWFIIESGANSLSHCFVLMHFPEHFCIFFFCSLWSIFSYDVFSPIEFKVLRK